MSVWMEIAVLFWLSIITSLQLTFFFLHKMYTSVGEFSTRSHLYQFPLSKANQASVEEKYCTVLTGCTDMPYINT